MADGLWTLDDEGVFTLEALSGDLRWSLWQRPATRRQ